MVRKGLVIKLLPVLLIGQGVSWITLIPYWELCWTVGWRTIFLLTELRVSLRFPPGRKCGHNNLAKGENLIFFFQKGAPKNWIFTSLMGGPGVSFHLLGFLPFGFFKRTKFSPLS